MDLRAAAHDSSAQPGSGRRKLVALGADGGWTGPAAVPVWSFGVSGGKVRVTVVAIPPATLAGHPAGFPGDQYWSSTTAHRAPDGSLTVTFIVPAAGTGPCAENYTARLVESVRAVAVLIEKVPKHSLPTGSEGSACRLIGYLRTVQVIPGHPPAGRIVIDGSSGMVLPQK